MVINEEMAFRLFTADQTERLSQEFRQAVPFPHLVIDNLFSETMLERILPEFDVKAEGWTSFKSQMQVKLATVPGTTLPPFAQAFFDVAYSGAFLRLLSRITGISGLIPDPSLFGGGMHEVPEGGYFQPHVDFQVHPVTGLRNRLVVITYLNPGWRDSDGGLLELWQTRPAACVTSIVPVFGRTVIIQQSDRAVHGHSRPVRAGLSRRAVIAYFYGSRTAAATTSARADTGYVASPGQTARQRAEVILRLVSPPLALNVLRAASGRIRAHRKVTQSGSDG